jgi:hypothetical protein
VNVFRATRSRSSGASSLLDVPRVRPSSSVLERPGVPARFTAGLKTGLKAGLEAGLRAGVKAGLRAGLRAGLKVRLVVSASWG